MAEARVRRLILAFALAVAAVAAGNELICRLGRSVCASAAGRKMDWCLLNVHGVFGAAAACGRLLGLDGLNYQVVVLFAALPTASSAYILAMRMGGDGRSVAWLISATTLGSMLTLPLWAAWLSR